MKEMILALGLVACLFPYTQIIPTNSYMQPYALFFCSLSFVVYCPVLLKCYSRVDAFALVALAFLGVVLFVVTCWPYTNPQDFKNLLSYISPVVFSVTACAILITNPGLARKIVVGSAVLWLFVGLVQTVFDPTFATEFVGEWQDAAQVVVDSGRGVLGLAPEPTHHGFHLLVLGTLVLLVRGNKYLAIACISAALLTARSSSAALALVLGAVLFLLLRPKYLLLSSPLMLISVYLIILSFGFGGREDLGRMAVLLSGAIENPSAILQMDGSVNMRLGGVVVGAKEILLNFFMPQGLSNDDWLSRIPQILSQNLWLFGLSSAGVPSGILLVIYQAGIFGAVLLGLCFVRFFQGSGSAFERWMLLCVLFVLLGQYSLSNPGFGVVFGFLMANRTCEKRMKILEGDVNQGPIAISLPSGRLAVSAELSLVPVMDGKR